MLILPLWLSLKTLYNELLISISTYLTTFYYNLHVKSVVVEDMTLQFVIENANTLKDFYGEIMYLEFDLLLDGSALFFNTPLTLALLLSIVYARPSSRKLKIKTTILGMLTLTLLHLFTFIVMIISILALLKLHGGVGGSYLSSYYLPPLFLEYFATFLNSYAVYFEPFLIALFTFFNLGIKEKCKETSLST